MNIEKIIEKCHLLAKYTGDNTKPFDDLISYQNRRHVFIIRYANCLKIRPGEILDTYDELEEKHYFISTQTKLLEIIENLDIKTEYTK